MVRLQKRKVVRKNEAARILNRSCKTFMTFERQVWWCCEPLRRATGVGRAVDTTGIPVAGTGEATAGAKWLDPRRPPDGRKDDPERKFQGGRWVQLTYAL